MLKVKNLSNADIDINDLGITIPANGIYDLSSKPKDSVIKSDDLIEFISNTTLLIVKSENPEVLFTKNESIRMVVDNTLDLTKITNSGEGVIVNENNGHLPNNDVINWNIEKYLGPNDNYSEKLILPIGKVATINIFSGGSFNVPTYLTLEWYKWFNEYNEFIRINPDVRINELYVAKIDGTVAAGDNTIKIFMNNGNLNDIYNLEIDMYYEIETNDGNNLITKITDINYDTNVVTINRTIPTGGCPLNARVALVDRPLTQIGNLISSNTINWVSPPRIQGDGISYIKITIQNEDNSEPGLVTALLNGWVESGNIGI